MYLLLVNPKAGNQRYRRIERPFTSLLNKLDIKYKIVIIDDLANVEDLIKQHAKTSLKAVVAVGGNGTVNAVIDALADYRNLPLAIIPISKANLLANTLGARDWKTGIKILAQHKKKQLRLGKIGERYFAGSLLISPKRTLLANLFEKKSLLRNFIGANTRAIPKEEHHVACTIKIDNEFVIKCQLHTMAIYFQDEFGKKMKIYLNTCNEKSPEKSIFRANHIEIESSLNMPIISGNDTVAHTPVKIHAIGKTITVLTSSKSPNQTS
ncbi:MAG: diacylglycerol kinase family protein [Patescibacteria group bacterium]